MRGATLAYKDIELTLGHSAQVFSCFGLLNSMSVPASFRLVRSAVSDDMGSVNSVVSCMHHRAQYIAWQG